MELIAKEFSVSERRSKPRVACEYTAIVRGHNGNGKKFEEAARVINLSANGMYMVINYAVQVGTEISVRVALPTGNLDLGSSKLATTGVVARSEPLSEGIYGIAIQIQHYRFQ